ncbi:AAA family ATPase [Lactiplantibacillus sp. WILCCON 0030]|uniref:AAA family ATPase n=2 Tax=Lactiplantibacillus brownii TaxID=3069269 RepID=A0ABU1ACQ9_9LACO|nr:AAA family ATPase [Lactiplantibacillus brownii]MDQ7938163.1 AAA family ATPase [Lactiplantibacillus brownii]
MFTGLEIENYKVFKNLKFKMIKANEPKKVVAIYGENGAGKSNIVSAFMNLSLSLRTVETQKQWTEIQTQVAADKSLNEDGNNRIPESMLTFIRSGSMNYRQLSQIFNRSTHMIGTTAPMRIRYDFEFDGHSGYYELLFEIDRNDKMYLASETLYYLIHRSSGKLFEIKSSSAGDINYVWSPTLFKNNEIGTLIDDSVERLWGTHTFLSILTSFVADTNQKYIKKNISSNLLKVIANFGKIAFRTDMATGVNSFNSMLGDLNQGQLKKTSENEQRLAVTKRALNQYFVPLYSDILEVFYRVKTDNDKLDYRLFVRKRVGGQQLTIPFDLESNGTKKLLNLLPLFLNVVRGETVIIDEIDQGIHDLLIDRLIDNLQEDISGQLIVTTHDTQVMRQLDLSALYVIQTDVEGNKQVVNLSKASKENIAAHNNVQKMYLNGYFSGIPYADDVDFYDILSTLGDSTDDE